MANALWESSESKVWGGSQLWQIISSSVSKEIEPNCEGWCIHKNFVPNFEKIGCEENFIELESDVFMQKWKKICFTSPLQLPHSAMAIQQRRPRRRKRHMLRLFLAIAIVCLLLSVLVDGNHKYNKRKRRNKKKMPHPYYRQSCEMLLILKLSPQDFFSVWLRN